MMLWDTVLSEIAYRCRIFAVRRQQSRSPRTGGLHDFHVIETPDWVNVIPITADGHVVMVRQYRHGIGALTLEVPAGIIDPTDASPAVAAARELREETGFESRRLIRLGAVHPNPAIMNNHCHMFVAYDAVLVGPPEWDGTEDLEVVTVPLSDVPRLVSEGWVTNALTIVAFHLLAINDAAAAAND